jgi:magnesium chelatase subunit D
MSTSQLWQEALLAAQVLASNLHGLGGVLLRCDAGPVRDAWMAAFKRALPAATPVKRMPAAVTDDRLYGGIDLAATLRAGKPVVERGLLAEADGGVLVVAMAERLSQGASAAIGHAIEAEEVILARDGLSETLPARIAVVACDEGLGEDEAVPPALAERLAFHIDLRSLSHRDIVELLQPANENGDEASEDEIMRTLVATAAALGIHTMRAPLLALRAARALAAMAGRAFLTVRDAMLAARWVIAPRARHAPVEPDEAPPGEPQRNEGETPGDDDAAKRAEAMGDLVLEAVRAALPPGLLGELDKAKTARGPKPKGLGAGVAQTDLQRGRPAGTRVGSLRQGARLDIIATLRVAAPWQMLRRKAARKRKAPATMMLKPEDFRLKKFNRPREATVVFCVDASGSAAMQRLGEAKGAIELLLSEAYAARTYVALVAFRGTGAETLLPPTRSLARAKALLAALPGGGGTPLAAGIEIAGQIADAERRKGRDPLIVLMTDARANIARGGDASRERGMADAHEAAAAIRGAGHPAVLVDTSSRPRDEASRLAAAMGARYVVLPVLDAAAVRDAVRLSA